MKARVTKRRRRRRRKRREAGWGAPQTPWFLNRRWSTCIRRVRCTAKTPKRGHLCRRISSIIPPSPVWEWSEGCRCTLHGGEEGRNEGRRGALLIQFDASVNLHGIALEAAKKEQSRTTTTKRGRSGPIEKVESVWGINGEYAAANSATRLHAQSHSALN